MGQESLQNYALRCKDAMNGIEPPAFNCEDGTEPKNEGSVYGSEGGGIKCDAPNVLHGECDHGSKFQVIRRGLNTATGAQDGIYFVAHCRKQNQANDAQGKGTFGDIAMIAYNKNTGATCFFQALDNQLPGQTIAPRLSTQVKPDPPALPPSNYYNWQAPAVTAGQGCAGCHDSGPFVRSPYLGQLAGKGSSTVTSEGVWLGGPETPVSPDVHYLPGTKSSEMNWNNSSQRYSFIGTDFQDWKTYAVRVFKPSSNPAAGAVEDTNCTGCHRLAYSTKAGTFQADIGTAQDYGPQSTAIHQASKHDHGPDSPIWMKPFQTYYYPGAGGNGGSAGSPSANEQSALDTKGCAKTTGHGEPLPAGVASCQSALIAEGNSCSPSNPQTVGGTATQSTDKTKKVKTSTPVAPACTDGSCDPGMMYFTSLHGPFYQDTSDPYTSASFRGAYVRTYIDTSNYWAFEAGLDATNTSTSDPSPGQPGGQAEFLKYARVASILQPKSCYAVPYTAASSSSTTYSVTTDLGSKVSLPFLSTVIGNVSRSDTTGASSLWVRTISPNNLIQQYRPNAASRNYWFSASSYVHTCSGWDASQALIRQNVPVSSSGSSDVQLVPAASANQAVCYLVGVNGNWAYTVPDPTNPGGSIQPYAQIYVGSGQDIRLKVYAPGGSAHAVGAVASCLKVNP